MEATAVAMLQSMACSQVWSSTRAPEAPGAALKALSIPGERFALSAGQHCPGGWPTGITRGGRFWRPLQVGARLPWRACRYEVCPLLCIPGARSAPAVG